MTLQEHYGGTSATGMGITDTRITDASVTVFIDEETLTAEELEEILTDASNR